MDCAEGWMKKERRRTETSRSLQLEIKMLSSGEETVPTRVLGRKSVMGLFKGIGPPQTATPLLSHSLPPTQDQEPEMKSDE